GCGVLLPRCRLSRHIPQEQCPRPRLRAAGRGRPGRSVPLQRIPNLDADLLVMRRLHSFIFAGVTASVLVSAAFLYAQEESTTPSTPANPAEPTATVPSPAAPPIAPSAIVPAPVSPSNDPANPPLPGDKGTVQPPALIPPGAPTPYAGP